MNRLGELLTKHRNAFLLVLLMATLLSGSIANRERLQAASATVDIPVIETAAQPVSALEAYRQQRDQQALSDIAALEKLVAQAALDESTRKAAADQLQALIDCRQAQAALEGALVQSSLYPCAAVVTADSVTIVTAKSAVTDKDSALVLTLAAAHVGASPENVRIITAE